MKLIILINAALLLQAFTGNSLPQDQPVAGSRILRRVIKSTPSATTLGRIRQVTVRSATPETGAVAEISSKEAANFGQRAANESIAPSPIQATKTKQTTSTSPAPPTTSTSTSTSTTTTTSAPSPAKSEPAEATTPSTVNKQSKVVVSERQQAGPEVELLAGSPSSWQSMTAVEAPAAMLIASGVRSEAASSGDLSSLASGQSKDFLRSSASSTKSYSSNLEDSGESFSRIRTSSKQQNYFFPSQTQSKTNTKTSTKWYQQPTTTTTQRPAPLIQEQQFEQQYVEQQAEYNAAPAGMAEPFAFDFNTRDNNGNGQYRKEESDKNGVVHGSYGYTDANGIYRHVEYVADHNGFRANIKSNEPGLIGETQPASIQLASGAAPSNRLSASQDDGSDNSGASSNWNNGESADLTAAGVPPNFESAHKPERIRRNSYRN